MESPLIVLSKLFINFLKSQKKIGSTPEHPKMHCEIVPPNFVCLIDTSIGLSLF